MIYAYAVTVNFPIHPCQVAERSNQFTWRGVRRCYAFPNCVCSPAPWFRNWTIPTVSQLMLSCSSICYDLERSLIFYRANTFRFCGFQEVITFMASITSAKRSSICRVILDMNDQGVRADPVYRTYIDWNSYLNSSKGVKEHTDAAVFLQECVDLQYLTCIFNFDKLWQSAGQLRDFLALIRYEFMNASRTKPSIWNIPTVDFLIYLDHHHRPIRLSQATSAVLDQHLPLQDSAHSLSFRCARAMLVSRQISLAIKSREMLLENEHVRDPRLETGRMMKLLLPPRYLQEAIRDAPLDFSGDDRAALDRMNSSAGSVSSRTRQQVERSKNVNQLGVIPPRPVAKYDAEGLVTWEIRKIGDIRFREGKFQCQVYFAPPAGVVWEDLESLFSCDGLKALRVYYQNFFRCTGTKLASRRLRRIRSLPTPRQVFAMARGWLAPLAEENKRLWKAIVRDWDALQTKHDAYLALLEGA